MRNAGLADVEGVGNFAGRTIAVLKDFQDFAARGII